MIVHFMTIYKLYYYNYCMFNFKKKKKHLYILYKIQGEVVAPNAYKN
jgi:hypothetical protein